MRRSKTQHCRNDTNIGCCYTRRWIMCLGKFGQTFVGMHLKCKDRHKMHWNDYLDNAWSSVFRHNTRCVKDFMIQNTLAFLTRVPNSYSKAEKCTRRHCSLWSWAQRVWLPLLHVFDSSRTLLHGTFWFEYWQIIFCQSLQYHGVVSQVLFKDF